MKKYILAIISIIFLYLIGYSQDNTTKATDQKNDSFKIIFENGLLIGSQEGQYPKPFSSHLSFVKKINNLYLGLGSGAEIIGRTYIPFFADIRYMPFNSKPFYIYGKGGYNLCLSNEYNENDNKYGGYYNYYPYPTTTDYKWHGGILAEAGFGIVLKMKSWDTSISLGYRYQKTKYENTDATNLHTYENYYNRLALRIGFWF
jgi:hypothetical protein